jgi:hypothetical protein
MPQWRTKRKVERMKERLRIRNTCKHSQTNFFYRLSFMGNLLPKYFKSEWSYAQLRIGDGRALCAFSEDGTTLIAVTTDGLYILADIPKNGGDCVIRERKNLLAT